MGDTASYDMSSNYFSSYEDLEVHRLMLMDNPRVKAYQKAILNRRELFSGRCVIDVGAGSGILSVLCAKAGAKRVIAVEASNLANLAISVVKENGLEDVIQVFHTRIEDLILQNDEKVDILVSEWMGFYLLHEGMLDSVIYAREKFLKLDGHIFPESATILAAPCSLPSLFESWSNVCGVSMRCFGEQLRQQKSQKPEVMLVPRNHIITDPQAICWIDLKSITIEQLNEFTSEVISVPTEKSLYQGMCIWFTCQFPTNNQNNEKMIELSTSPFDEPTHWKQTVIVLPKERWLERGEPIAWQLSIKRKNNDRKYNLELTLLDPDDIEHPLPCNCWKTTCIITKQHLKNMEQAS